MLKTQTIDIEHVQRILNSCPYYDQIVNYRRKTLQSFNMENED